MARAYLIAGAGGMLGTALQEVIAERCESCTAPSEATFDITDEPAVTAAVESFAAGLPEGATGVLVNAAAYTNVERAEDDADTAYRVNETGAAILAAAARDAGLRFVHVSTDFVFDGRKSGPYTEDDAPNPLSVYGASKLAGEVAVIAENPSALVVRTAWVFGPAGANFPLKVIAVAREKGEVSVVTDEYGSPTYTVDLAAGILELIEREASGLFHLAGAGSCNRFELAAETLRLVGLGDVPMRAVTADAFPMKAARPRNSVLDCSKAAKLGVAMPSWTDALRRFVERL